MDPDSIFLLVMIVLLLLMSVYFALTETAFSSLNRIRIKNMAENGHKRAALVLRLGEDYDKLISTILVGNNIVNLTSASLGAVLFINLIGEEFGVTLSTIVITIVVIIFCEVTPKCLAKQSPERFALLAAPLLNFLEIVLTPVNFFFNKWNVLIKRLLKTGGEDRSITEQELLSMVDEAEHEGAIDENDHLLIHNAIEFNDLRASDVLTPRMDVEGLPKNSSLDEMAERFLTTGYSRFPVYEESIDHIIGVVHMRDFFRHMIKKDASIEKVISPAVFVAPSIKLSVLFKQLQKEKSHLAVVTDEYGGTAGIVTMEDILEELVGEIWDESDEIIEEFIPLGLNKIKVMCSADIKDMLDYFEVKPDEEVESSTVNGWIMDMLGKIPEEGDAFDYKHLTVTVHKTEHRRVLECIVTVNKEGNEETGSDV
jgi:CBS domain containing-hemolysin-like protein